MKIIIIGHFLITAKKMIPAPKQKVANSRLVVQTSNNLIDAIGIIILTFEKIKEIKVNGTFRLTGAQCPSPQSQCHLKALEITTGSSKIGPVRSTSHKKGREMACRREQYRVEANSLQQLLYGDKKSNGMETFFIHSI